MIKFNLERVIRKNIKDLLPYTSARSECPNTDYILLDANENNVASGWGYAYDKYPDPFQKELKRILGEFKGIDPDMIFIGNGSDEVIDLLIRATCEPGKDNIIICPPTYGMYEVTGQINNVEVRKALLLPNFQLDISRINEESDRNSKLIFICSPNNPTANLMSVADIEYLLHVFRGIVVIDEAYIDFSTGKSWLTKINKHPNLVVMQTFSKTWGLAAIRTGIAYASQELIAILSKIKAPYNVSQCSQQLAIESLQAYHEVEKSINYIREQKEVMLKTLSNLFFVHTIYPSETNFLLVKVQDANSLYDYLLSQKIVVRNRNTQPLCDNCLRITIGTAQENQLLITALKKYNL